MYTVGAKSRMGNLKKKNYRYVWFLFFKKCFYSGTDEVNTTVAIKAAMKEQELHVLIHSLLLLNSS